MVNTCYILGCANCHGRDKVVCSSRYRKLLLTKERRWENNPKEEGQRGLPSEVTTWGRWKWRSCFRCCLSNWWINGWFRSTSKSLEKQVRELHAELEITWKDNQAMRSEVTNRKSLNPQLTVSPAVLKDNPELLKFYAGIPDWTIFMALLNLLYPAIPDTPTCM